MEKNIIILMLVLVVIVVLPGCDLMNSIFGPSEATESSEAAITAFTEAGIINDAEIDVENKTITITVEPMDLSSFNPEITISEGADLTEPDSISDGVAATYTVTAENGDLMVWTVTINVQYGVSFLLDGTKIVLTNGYENSTDPTANARVGAGVPGVYITRPPDSTDDFVQGFSSENKYDLATSPTPLSFDYFNFSMNGSTIGMHSDGDSTFTDYSESSNTDFDTGFLVTEFGDLGGVFRATFSGSNADASSSITKGYAKILVVEGL